MDYYNNWWNNSGGNNWYMDPHKSALNQPPPAHNMSGPPQHPPPHGMPMPMGQPMPPRAMQPEYMLPRPAHTGSSVNMGAKPNQTAVLGQKAAPHPGGSSSPKPPMVPGNPPIDKSAMGINLPSPNIPVSNAGKVASIPPLIPTANSASVAAGLKPVHSMSQQPQQHQQQQQQQQQQMQQQMHQQHQHQLQQQQQQQQQAYHQHNQMHQQRPVQHMQQPMQSQPAASTPQQHMQINQQQLPSTATQHHNQMLQNVAVPKQEAPKGPTPPVPDLISISKQPPVLPVTSPKLTQPAENNKTTSLTPQNVNSTSTKPLPNVSSGVTPVAPVKPVVTSIPPTPAPSTPVNNLSTVSASVPKPLETPKATNVSITPAKPAVTAQKPEPVKTADSSNTVTITPSVKSAECLESKISEAPKNNSELPVQNITSSIPTTAEPNLNGVSSNKSVTKVPAVNASKPVEQITSETKISNAPITVPPRPVTVNSSQQATSGFVKSNQQSAPSPKQPPTAVSPSKQPAMQQSPVKIPAPVTPQKPVNVMPVTPVISPPASNAVTSQQSPLKPVTPVVTSPAKSSNLKVSSPPVTPQQCNQINIPSSNTPKPSIPVQVAPQQKLSASIAPKQNDTPVPQSIDKSKIETTAVKPVTEKPETQPIKKDIKTTSLLTKKAVLPERQPRGRKPVEKPLVTPEKEASPTKKVESPVKPETSSKQVASEADEDETPRRRAARTKRKVSETPSEGERKSKRSRNPASVYQSPIPNIVTRLTPSTPSTPKASQEKLVMFFKNEHVALRNAEGTFYLCQIAQNVYKTTRKIKIRWLSPVDEKDNECDRYKPDYYDVTDFDCILTSVALRKAEKSVMRLPIEERKRILNILQRAMDRDKGISPEKSDLAEDHPDGLDLSLYNDESQLKKRKRKGRKPTEGTTSDESGVESGEEGEEGKKYDDEESDEELENHKVTPTKKDSSEAKVDGAKKSPTTKTSDKKDEVKNAEKNMKSKVIQKDGKSEAVDDKKSKSKQTKSVYEMDDDDDEEEDEDEEDEDDESDYEEPPSKVSRTLTGGRSAARGSPQRGRGKAINKAATPATVTAASTPKRGGRAAPTPRGPARNSKIAADAAPVPVTEKKEVNKLEATPKPENAVEEAPVKNARASRGAAKPALPKQTPTPPKESIAPSTKSTRRTRK